MCLADFIVAGSTVLFFLRSTGSCEEFRFVAAYTYQWFQVAFAGSIEKLFLGSVLPLGTEKKKRQ